MTFLFISLACFVVFAAIFAVTYAIDHFEEIWQAAGVGGWRGRFSEWEANNRKLDVLQGLSGLASAFAGLAFMVAMDYALTFVGVGGERRFARYISGGAGESLREFHATSGDLSRIPTFDYVDNHHIVKGRVSSIVPIGGGLMHVCVADGEYCGLADSSLALKNGDNAYIRIGRPPTGRGRPPGWAVTAGEAKALEATTKFRIEDT